VAEISDRTGHGGPGYFWKLEIRAPRPGFKVYSARSALPLIRGAALKTDFIALREDGFDGAITVRFPAGVSARGCIFTPEAERITAELVYTGGKAFGPGKTEIFAEAQIGGNLKRVKVVPCDEYEQAFAWKHLVPAQDFVMFAVPKPKPKPKPPGKSLVIGQ
jgi:hypothetical protein